LPSKALSPSIDKLALYLVALPVHFLAASMKYPVQEIANVDETILVGVISAMQVYKFTMAIG
jgi:hypothetical protein